MRIASKATKGKGRQWKKGQSSSSNPTTSKFRDAAKTRAAFGNAGQVNDVQELIKAGEEREAALTIERLANHNAFNLQYLSLGADERDEDAKTNISFASAWSKCSNPSFERFLNGWSSTSALHKSMLAVLASVTEAIKEN